MANAVYPKGLEGFLGGTIDWDTDTIKLALVDAGVYTYSAAHQFMSSIVAGGATIARSSAFTSRTVTNGVADAADVTLTAVTGTSVEIIVIFKDTGSDATSPVIVYIDTATGLPVTPNGGDITVQWDNGSNKIFSL